MRCVCCPDKFRGSLTAAEAAAALAAGAREAGAEAIELPLADGGEGTLEILLAARGGERRTTRVAGPLGDAVDADWALLGDGTAVLEMATASGLDLVGVAGNDPLRASTAGTGELIAAAVDAGARRVLVGLGGSATTDGGLGAVEALGWSLGGAEVIVACDVETAFADAATVFGPQKGASPGQVEELTARLQALAERYRAETGVAVQELAGAGAAGGLAGGLAALGALLRPGFAVVADAVGLRDALAQADVVLTGEGRLDGASLHGKVVGGVLAAAPRGTPCGVVVGDLDDEAAAALPDGVLVRSLTARAGSAETAIANAADLVREAARELVADACAR